MRLSLVGFTSLQCSTGQICVPESFDVLAMPYSEGLSMKICENAVAARILRRTLARFGV